MPVDPIIRAEQHGDEDGIENVLRSCFPTAAESQLVRVLRRAGRLTTSMIAIVGNQIIGHASFSPVKTEQNEEGLGLAPVAVLPDFRRQGIAARLIESGLQFCRTSGCPWCVVLGEPAYYVRFGFQPASRYGLMDEYGGGDSFQVLELTTNSVPKGAGLVRYAPEFAIFS